MGDTDDDHANKKVFSVIYQSLGEAARKQFKDKYPHETRWDLKAGELIGLSTEGFKVERTQTLDRHQFSRDYNSLEYQCTNSGTR